MVVIAYPDLFVVEKSEDLGTSEFTATLRAKQVFSPGQVMAKLEGVRSSPKHCTTLQYGSSKEDNIRLLTELVYVNHSCKPNAIFDLSSAEPADWHLRALEDIAPGDDSE
ncbi:hypothetical protein EIP86_008379 [Pleurotus ostreatoroseus]|nr:hypothetical protein EIP86_008379 [Pleurotus ostreatoroseus]